MKEQEILDMLKIKDLSINGKCCKCGECCSNILLITQEELDVIQEYVIKYNIKLNKTMLVMANKIYCPYFDGKKCLIYEIRPLICREFYCNKLPTPQIAHKMNERENIVIDMWKVAEDIENQRKRINARKM